MKVLIVSQPASDGVFRYVEGLADFLLSRGVQVHLAYSDRGACDRLAGLVDRVTAAGGQTLNLRVGNAPAPADIPALLSLWKMIRTIDPDVIHAHSSKAGVLVRGLAFFGTKRRVFYTPHAYYRMNAQHGVKARFFHAIERVFKQVGTTLCCSLDEAAFARECIRVSPARQQTITNGVDVARFRPAQPDEAGALRAKFDLPAGALVLGTVGRFSAQKDPLTTYAALARVASQVPNLFFIHLGKGELEPEVDALLAQHHLAGRCLRISYLGDTAPFYRMLDGLILASLFEGMSYAIIEAMASNLPLILSRAPGNQDFANYGLDHIHWAPPGNPDALAEAILAWQRQIAAGGASPNHRAIAVEQFSMETGYTRLLALYKNEQTSIHHPECSAAEAKYSVARAETGACE